MRPEQLVPGTRYYDYRRSSDSMVLLSLSLCALRLPQHVVRYLDVFDCVHSTYHVRSFLGYCDGRRAGVTAWNFRHYRGINDTQALHANNSASATSIYLSVHTMHSNYIL